MMVMIEPVDLVEKTLNHLRENGIVKLRDIPFLTRENRRRVALEIDSSGKGILFRLKRTDFIGLEDRMKEIEDMIENRINEIKEVQREAVRNYISNKSTEDRRNLNRRSANLKCIPCNIDWNLVRRTTRIIFQDTICQLCRNVQFDIEITDEEPENAET